MISNHNNKQRLTTKLPPPRLPQYLKNKPYKTRCSPIRSRVIPSHTTVPEQESYPSSNDDPTKDIDIPPGLPHITSIHTIYSSSDCNTPRYTLLLSPTTTPRNQQIALDEILSDYASTKDDKSCENIDTNQMMMQSSTNCDSSGISHNNSPNENNKQGNINGGNNNNQDGGYGNNNSNYGSGGSGGSGNGGRKPSDDDGDDHKKNDKKQNETQEEEEEDKDDEKAVISGKFSEVSCLLLDGAHKTVSLNDHPFRYNPVALPRAQGMIRISTNLTETIIPNMTDENIQNVYGFIDKSTALAVYHQHYYDNGQIRIFDYGFRDTSRQSLYCVTEKIKPQPNTKFDYKMKDKLFTKDELLIEFGECNFPVSPRDLIRKQVDIEKLQNKLKNDAAFCKHVIFKTKWHKQHIFDTKISKKYHKQRHTFSIVKNDFISIIEREIHKQKCRVIPIVMFYCNGYRIEYMHIIKLKKDISIGISYIYNNNQKYGVKVTGIHLNKENIVNQHQLASINHDCHCLDTFTSEIDELRIGNPDDDINRYNAAKNEVNQLKTQLKETERMKLENEQLKKQVEDFRQQNRQISELQIDVRQFRDVIFRLNNDLNQQNDEIDILSKDLIESQNNNQKLHELIEYYREVQRNNNSISTSHTPLSLINNYGSPSISYPHSISYSNRSTRGVSNASSYSRTPQSLRMRTTSNVSEPSSLFSTYVNSLMPINTNVSNNNNNNNNNNNSTYVYNNNTNSH